MSNFNSKGFPYHRGRRLRNSSNLRDIVSQAKFSLDDLVITSSKDNFSYSVFLIKLFKFVIYVW